MKKISPVIIVTTVLALFLIILALFIRFNDSVARSVGLSVESSRNQQNFAVGNTNTEYVSPDSLNSGLNQTDEISKKLLAQFLDLKQSGNLNENTTKSLVESISSQIKIVPPKIYTAVDIKIIPNQTKEDIKNYANSFWTIKTKYKNLFIQRKSPERDPALDFAGSLLTKDILIAANLYTQMGEEVSKLTVPASLVDLHLKLVNNYIASGVSLKQLENSETDPISTIAGLNNFSNYSDYESTTLIIMADYFKASGIIFNKTDPAFGWNSL